MKKKSKKATENVPAVRRSTELSTSVVNLADLVDEFTDDDIADQTKSDGEFGTRANFFRFKPKNFIRLCPKRKGSKILYKECYRMWVSDAGAGKAKPITSVAKMRPPGKDYVLEALEAALARVEEKIRATRNKAALAALAKDKQAIMRQMPRWGAFWNIIDMENPEAGAMVAWFPATVHRWIKEQTGLAEHDVDKRPWDINEGFPIRIIKDESTGKTEYKMRFLESKAGRLDDECYLGMADLEAEAAPLTDAELRRIGTFVAAQYEVLDDLDWAEAAEDEDEEDEEDDEDYKPVKGRKKARVVEEDEDEDEEEDEDEDEEDDEEKPAPKKKRKKEYIEPIIEVPTKSKKRKKSAFDETDSDDPWGMT